MRRKFLLACQSVKAHLVSLRVFLHLAWPFIGKTDHLRSWSQDVILVRVSERSVSPSIDGFSIDLTPQARY